MLAIADHADKKLTAFPSLTLLSEKANVTRRNVVNAINRLIEIGELERVGTGRQGVTIYRINLTQTSVADDTGVGNDTSVDIDTPTSVADDTPSSVATDTLTINKPSIEPSIPPKAPQDEFDQWYSEYPKKVARGQAVKAFPKAIKKVSLGEMIEATRRYAETTNPKYFCNPATWLNGERWLDQTGEHHVTDQYHNLGTDSINAVAKMFRGVVPDRDVPPGRGRQGPDEARPSNGQAVNAAGLRRDTQGGWVDGGMDKNLFQHVDAPRDQGGDPDVRRNAFASAGGFGDPGG